MRTLAIGDIHGCSHALTSLLAAIRLAPEDQLVTLGDYVDRGPDSAGVLDRLIVLHAGGRLVALRGNHELMMLRARHGWDEHRFWVAVGGRQTLASYGGTLADVPLAHWEFLHRACVDWFETETHFFVHANAHPDRPLAEQHEQILQWEAVDSPVCSRPHMSGKVMVCGHSQQRSGRPLDLGHAVCIDTYAYGGGWLTCLEPATGRIWQANQDGEVRTGRLDEADDS